MKAEYDWEDKTIGKIKERLGMDEGTNNDGDSKIEEDKNVNGKDYDGKRGDDVKKVLCGKVVGGIIDESKEKDNDDNKRPQKHRLMRKK